MAHLITVTKNRFLKNAGPEYLGHFKCYKEFMVDIHILKETFQAVEKKTFF